MVRRLTVPLFLAVCATLVAVPWSSARAVESTPADAILPDTTKFYLSIDDLDGLLHKWQQTESGRLTNQPSIKPFVDELKQQFQRNMSLLRRLGTDWSEIQRLEIRGMHWAVVQPDNDPEQVAVAFVGDVRAGASAAQSLARLLARLRTANVTVSQTLLEGQQIQAAQWPKQGQYTRQRNAYFYVVESTILASDQSDILAAMIRRRTEEVGSLRQFKPYAEIRRRCTLSNLDEPDLQWFAEPFGFAEALRASNGGRRKRGRDLLKILPRQGFAAIQGMGGVLRMHCQDFDNLAQAYIYAPAAPGQAASAGGDRFVKAARMLSFPNRDDATPLDWIPADMGSYITLRCKLGEAFEHSKSLIDDMAAQPVFEDVLKSIELDHNGPQVNLRTALVGHLGQRVVVLTQAKPATAADGSPQGGRTAGLAIELTNSQAVEATLTQIMSRDPNAKRLEHDGSVLWLMVTSDDEPGGLDDPGGFDSFAPPSDEAEDDGLQLFPNRIFFVAHDHLIVTTSEDLAKRLLQSVAPANSLAQSVRYARVRQTLTDLGATKDCFRFFVKTSKLVESGYRQLRLSERFDLFDDFGLLMEKVWVDGKKLPPYEQVTTDMGDSGIYVHSEDDGWKIVGFLLKNESGE